MEIFLVLIAKLIPLYLVIVLWYLARKHLDIDKQSIARLLLYVVAPVVTFLWVYKAELNLASLSLPVLFFVLACSLWLIFYFIGSKVYWADNTLKNILAFTAGSWNTGYFGIPVVLVLFWEEMFSLAILSILGFILYENTLWFFLVAKWNFSIKQALYKVAKLPNIHAIILWLALNIWGVSISDTFLDWFWSFKWAYSVFAMMLIGMWLVWISAKSFDRAFSWLSFWAKFFGWPALIGLVIYLDMQYLGLYNSDIYSLMFLMSIVPLAANTIVLAVEFKTRPDMVTINVLLSTLLALLIIPLSVIFIFPLFW